MKTPEERLGTKAYSFSHYQSLKIKTGSCEINNYCITATDVDLFSFHNFLSVELQDAPPISVHCHNEAKAETLNSI